MRTTEVKAASGSKLNLILNSPYPNKDSMLALLNAILMPRKGEPVVSPKEAAHLFGYKSDRMVYAILKGEKAMKAEHYQMLAFECVKRGDLRLVDCILPNNYHVAHNDTCAANGSIQDESTRATIAQGKANLGFETGNMALVDEALPELMSAAVGYYNERKLRMS